MLITPQTPIQFLLDHLQHLGWGVVIAGVLRVVWWLRGAKEKAEAVFLQTTNHMPHSLDRIDRNIAVLVGLQGGKAIMKEEDEN
jgi:hypothetical protein